MRWGEKNKKIGCRGNVFVSQRLYAWVWMYFCNSVTEAWKERETGEKKDETAVPPVQHYSAAHFRFRALTTRTLMLAYHLQLLLIIDLVLQSDSITIMFNLFSLTWVHVSWFLVRSNCFALTNQMRGIYPSWHHLQQTQKLRQKQNLFI